VGVEPQGSLHLQPLCTRHTTEPCLWRTSRWLPGSCVRSRCACLVQPRVERADRVDVVDNAIVCCPQRLFSDSAPRSRLLTVNMAAGIERFRQRGTGSLRPTTLATAINRWLGAARPFAPVVDSYAKQGVDRRESASMARNGNLCKIGPCEPAAWSPALECGL
jgi:hypothetical protein